MNGPQFIKCFCCIIFLACTVVAHAQDLLNKDSLLRLLPKAKEDSNKVLLLIQVGQQYEGSEPELAKQYYLQARNLSRKTGYLLGEIKFAANYTYVLNMQGHYDSSLQINQQSVALAKKSGSREYIFKALFNLGTSYRMLENYEAALQSYLEAYPIVVSFKDDALSGQALDILQSLYTELRQYQKGLQHGRQAVALLKNAGNPVLLAMALSNLGMNYGALRMYDSALISYQQAVKLSKEAGDLYIESAGYLNIADVYLKQQQFEKTGPYYTKALALSKNLESIASQVIAYRGLGYFYLHRNENDKAKRYADSSLQLAIQLNSKAEKQKTYHLLSSLAMSEKKLRQAEAYSMQAGELADSLMNETIQRHTIEMDKKYQTELKDKQIRLQQSDIRHSKTLNYLLIGSAITILLISALGYRNYRNRQQLQQQRIHELETEKQLAATEAVLKGEDQERTRLAKDLHDGLGGMLSGIKYSLHSMKGNLIMTPENAQAFERSIDMLDSSISEMRRVAHNMMPEVLVKFGLDAALRDFCNDINESGVLKVTYQSIGMENVQVENTKSVTIYRIVQELLSNTIKHAAASTALVQLSNDANQLCVTVEDDGKGFDPKALGSARGIGWSNIRNRVEFLKGRLDIASQPSKGTSVLIEVTI